MIGLKHHGDIINYKRKWGNGLDSGGSGCEYMSKKLWEKT